MNEPTPSDQKAAPPKRRSFPKLPIILLILAGVGYFIWKRSQPAPVPAGLVVLSGRIEGDDSAISPKIAGRIVDIRVREGDVVKAGDVIAVLDSEQLVAREQQAAAAVSEADSKVNMAQQQVAVLQDQLLQINLQKEQSGVDAKARVSQAEAEVAAAEAQLAQQESALQIALWDRDAYTKLANDGAVSERQGKQAQSTAATQQAVVAAAHKKVDSAHAALNVAKANLTNPDIRGAQAAGVQKQIIQQQAQITTARAEATRTRAQLSESQVNQREVTVVAPFDGTVATRTAEPGEVVQAGTPIVTLLDLTKVYLRGFVPEGQIGRVRAGQAARIYLDSAPTKPVDAIVTRIDPQATFTPENTYFREDRVKQVVGVKLQLKAGQGFAKPGMPADGEILVEGDTWPASIRK